MTETRSKRQLEADEKRRAGMKAYWDRTHADPELYQAHITKASAAIKDAFLKQRMRGNFSGGRKPSKVSDENMKLINELGQMSRLVRKHFSHHFWLLLISSVLLTSCNKQHAPRIPTPPPDRNLIWMQLLTPAPTPQPKHANEL